MERKFQDIKHYSHEQQHCSWLFKYRTRNLISRFLSLLLNTRIKQRVAKTGAKNQTFKRGNCQYQIKVQDLVYCFPESIPEMTKTTRATALELQNRIFKRSSQSRQIRGTRDSTLPESRITDRTMKANRRSKRKHEI